jgi:hypothetical protein
MDEWIEEIKRHWIINMDDSEYLKNAHEQHIQEARWRSLRGRVPPLSTKTPVNKKL